MIEYFESNYAWNLAATTLAEEAGNFPEFEPTLRRLKPYQSIEAVEASQRWHCAFAELGDHMVGLAQTEEAKGHYFSAARRYHRASMYYLKAERMLSHRDPQRLATYGKSLVAYKKARVLNRDPVEFVDIPYKASSMPALFVPGEGPGPRPMVIHLQGFDSVKESQYPYLEGYSRRGLSVLIVDQPGAGQAIRERGLTAEVETENYVRAIVDYACTRSDVDANRIGLAGISMGGYFAPRAAAYEPRIRAVACWGALYDFGELSARRANATDGADSVPAVLEHALWCFGVQTPEECLAIARRMNLRDVMPRVTCPLLVTHGADDRQVPLDHAQRTYDEAASKVKTLKIFTKEDGGAAHCQLDNRYLGSDVFGDWFAEQLGGTCR
ncbi:MULTISPECIES: alpha/beta hydrolase family protein [Paraburkholderia]|uniref:Prolyl oligopeptidase family serine peptidase n=1 Tax=Paraburkholderia madseniana TaxID=2599607 RepID=A0AAP5BLI0_9BURK|nr:MULTISPECIES: prolyl oligopeptidase family serine peptidase [Paraburkholderia]MCX4152040.1 prolyl oligopeptidase family serine peptidase [Paraburkholderia madseniana]MCX4175635.1 prolyl oligopeptidase family serine peptidase [Paraburkholderia madseniana]MDN7154968.1 prolyl oligopeptidase family serine peptidase [Paraburkholderia sp. WS6]MDQ6413851.1 prolyl oligopeptidase family serine peptidase [Paraburkholderia madseniana]MDQ6463631.1 prolyl oligopeptidase family serine peptidase [Paraburk